MGEIHRLPEANHDDRRLIDVTVGELRELIASELQRTPVEPERPLTIKEFAAIYGVDAKRVYAWIEAGMPHIRTGDQRGTRIWADQGHAWVRENRG